MSAPAGTETVACCRAPFACGPPKQSPRWRMASPPRGPRTDPRGRLLPASRPRPAPSNEGKEKRPASQRAACGGYLPASASDGASALFGSCPFQVPTQASFGVAPITKSSVPPAFISSYVMYGRCSGVPFRLTDWT